MLMLLWHCECLQLAKWVLTLARPVDMAPTLDLEANADQQQQSAPPVSNQEGSVTIKVLLLNKQDSKIGRSEVPDCS